MLPLFDKAPDIESPPYKRKAPSAAPNSKKRRHDPIDDRNKDKSQIRRFGSELLVQRRTKSTSAQKHRKSSFKSPSRTKSQVLFDVPSMNAPIDEPPGRFLRPTLGDEAPFLLDSIDRDIQSLFPKIQKAFIIEPSYTPTFPESITTEFTLPENIFEEPDCSPVQSSDSESPDWDIDEVFAVP